MDGDTASSTTPFTPPTTEEARLSWLRLIRSRRVGPGSFLRLVQAHGSAEAALHALPGIARASGIDDYHPFSHDDARREMDAGARVGARLLCLGDPLYPTALAALPDAPPVLWARGRSGLLAGSLVAMVGARNASALGGRMARKLAEGLGWHGHVTVSGLARGIDTAAHGASLKTGTVAVMAGGVDVIYPAENAALAAAIADQGVLLSEQPIGMQPQARHFPARNRIIAGLARAVVVIEAAEGSGSLITARHALDQGRELLAVPGHPLDGRAAGCNALIRDGAVLIRDVADIIDVIGRAQDFAAGESGAGRIVIQAPAAPHRDRPAPKPVRNRAAETGGAGQVQPPAGQARNGEQPSQRAATTAGAPPFATGQAQDAKATERRGQGRCANQRLGAARTSGASSDDNRGQARRRQGPDVPRGTAQGTIAASGAPGRSHAEAGHAMPDMLRLHRMILDLLGPSPLAEDQLIRDLALPAARVAPALLFLELDGRVQRQPGGMLVRR